MKEKNCKTGAAWVVQKKTVCADNITVSKKIKEWGEFRQKYERMESSMERVFTFVRSMPKRTWERRCMMTLLCSSTDSPSGSSSRSSWLSNGSEDNSRGQVSHGWKTTDFPATSWLNIFYHLTKLEQDFIELIESEKVKNTLIPDS